MGVAPVPTIAGDNRGARVQDKFLDVEDDIGSVTAIQSRGCLADGVGAMSGGKGLNDALGSNVKRFEGDIDIVFRCEGERAQHFHRLAMNIAIQFEGFAHGDGPILGVRRGSGARNMSQCQDEKDEHKK